MNDARSLATELRSAAEAAGSYVVAAPLDTDRATCPIVLLSATELLSFVAVIRPPIVYLLETVLDVDAEIASAFEEIEAEQEDRALAEIKRAARPLEEHEGQTVRTSVEIVTGGVLHVAFAAAPGSPTSNARCRASPHA